MTRTREHGGGYQGRWCADPSERHELRYWDGTGWTEHVLDAGWPGRDPLPAAPAGSSGDAPPHPEWASDGPRLLGTEATGGESAADVQGPGEPPRWPIGNSESTPRTPVALAHAGSPPEGLPVIGLLLAERRVSTGPDPATTAPSGLPRSGGPAAAPDTAGPGLSDIPLSLVAPSTSPAPPDAPAGTGHAGHSGYAVTARPAPVAGIAPRTHLLLGIASCGLWLLALPALALWRRGARLAAACWAGCLLLVVGLALGAVIALLRPAPVVRIAQQSAAVNSTSAQPATAHSAGKRAGSPAGAALPTAPESTLSALTTAEVVAPATGDAP